MPLELTNFTANIGDRGACYKTLQRKIQQYLGCGKFYRKNDLVLLANNCKYIFLKVERKPKQTQATST